VSAKVEEVIRVPCNIQSVYTVRRRIRRLAEGNRLRPDDVDDLVLAVNEAATNAIRYGCPAGQDVEIRWARKEGCIEVEIQDAGTFRKRIPLPDLEDSHGRGIPLMIALVDELHIREGTRSRPGTVVRLVKCGGR
jgi:anti-sigma regulatory factor (Ser/Thr protein kinase)